MAPKPKHLSKPPVPVPITASEDIQCLSPSPPPHLGGEAAVPAKPRPRTRDTRTLRPEDDFDPPQSDDALGPHLPEDALGPPQTDYSVTPHMTSSNLSQNPEVNKTQQVQASLLTSSICFKLSAGRQRSSQSSNFSRDNNNL